MSKINWKFKKDVQLSTDEFWYDITDGGYLKPEELLDDDKQIKKLKEAVAIVWSFEDAVYEKIEEDEEGDE